MTNANLYQLGGSHYKGSDYEPWDFIVNCWLGFLEGNVVRYMARWDKKGDPDLDLRKARHYIEKLQECVYQVRQQRRPITWLLMEVQKFCNANNLDGDTRGVIFRITTWETPADLEIALDHIDFLLANLHGTKEDREPTPGVELPGGVKLQGGVALDHLTVADVTGAD